MRRVLACAALLALARAGGADAGRVLTVGGYGDELRAIDSALAAGDATGASERARGLGSARVAFAGEEVAVDPSLVAAVTAGAPQAARVRIRAVLRGLDTAAPAVPDPDAELLRRAQRAEARTGLPSGGHVGGMPVQPSLPQRFLDAVASALRTVGDAIDKFLTWLRKLWPQRKGPETASGLATTWTVMVLVIAVAVVMALLAVAALRRSTAAEEPASRPLPSSRRDADPLSREQEEWEAYAAELAAAGRTREAIRAWYHAVLVGLFRAGLLHHHKGRTNWEYVARVSPERAWRPELIRLTRRFDQEWYGSERSAAESLRDCAAEARSILRQVRGEMAA